MRKILENRKAWLRIIEAFIAVMIVMSVLIIIIVRQRTRETREEEILKLQRFILAQISENDNLRSEILNNDTSGVNNTVKKLIPDWLDYSTNICKWGEVCPNPNITPYEEGKEVYADEVLIVANLTYYEPEEALKLKLFFWEK